MWHRFGVRYNTVLPGFIETPTTDSIPEEVKEQVCDQYATTGRGLLGQGDICLLVFFLQRKVFVTFAIVAKFATFSRAFFAVSL